MDTLPKKSECFGTLSRTFPCSLQGNVSRRVGNMRSVIMRGEAINTDLIFGVTKTIQELSAESMCVFP